MVSAEEDLLPRGFPRASLLSQIVVCASLMEVWDRQVCAHTSTYTLTRALCVKELKGTYSDVEADMDFTRGSRENRV